MWLDQDTITAYKLKPKVILTSVFCISDFWELTNRSYITRYELCLTDLPEVGIEVS